MDSNSGNISTTVELHNPLLLKSKTMDSESYSTDTEEGIRTEKKRGFERGSRRGSYSKGPHRHTKCRIISAAENGADWRAVASANGIPIQTAYG